MTHTDGGGTSDKRPRRVIGLAADPGLPADLARWLSERLPDLLTRHVSADVRWEVRVVVRELALDPRGRLPLVATARRLRREEAAGRGQGCDHLVCLTELPLRSAGRTVAAAVSRSHQAALVSVPAVGWVRMRHNVRTVLLRVVDALSADGEADGSRLRSARRNLAAVTFSPVRPVVSRGEDVDMHLVLTTWRGQARLLLGMVRANRPWRLVPSMSKAIAAATATGAFGIFYPSIWSMADALSPLRLLLISLFAVTALVVWLIVHNGLWDPPRRREDRRDSVLYNLATVLTLLVGGLCMYLVLFTTTLTAAVAVIAADYLQERLGHPAGFSDYLTLAWLASSMGTVAGALGSTLESEAAVRQATYSKREQQRRARREEEEEEEEEAEGAEAEGEAT